MSHFGIHCLFLKLKRKMKEEKESILAGRHTAVTQVISLKKKKKKPRDIYFYFHLFPRILSEWKQSCRSSCGWRNDDQQASEQLLLLCCSCTLRVFVFTSRSKKKNKPWEGETILHAFTSRHGYWAQAFNYSPSSCKHLPAYTSLSITLCARAEAALFWNNNGVTQFL